MGHGHDHSGLLTDIVAHLKPVFDNSTDGVYVFLDDGNMACNERCAKIWGDTPAEWAKRMPFLQNLVAESDQAMFSKSYQTHVGKLSRPVTFRFTGKRKDGSTFNAETDMIPLSFSGHAVAYHFVREV
jgi:PAS domain S-box-containing protein